MIENIILLGKPTPTPLTEMALQENIKCAKVFLGTTRNLLPLSRFWQQKIKFVAEQVNFS